MIFQDCTHSSKIFDFQFSFIESLLGFQRGCFVVLHIKPQTYELLHHLLLFTIQVFDYAICIFQNNWK